MTESQGGAEEIGRPSRLRVPGREDGARGRRTRRGGLARPGTLPDGGGRRVVLEPSRSRVRLEPGRA